MMVSERSMAVVIEKIHGWTGEGARTQCEEAHEKTTDLNATDVNNTDVNKQT